MFGYIYMTINKINGKRYIGQKTAKHFLGEKYLGSGDALQQAIAKHGAQNFQVEMLESCESRHELNIREAYYISLYNAVKDENFYNLREGGHGGSVKGQTRHTDSHKKYMSERMSGESNPNFGSNTNHWTEESRRSVSIKNSSEGNPHFGIPQSEEAKSKISAKAKGRVWINNGSITKHVRPEELDNYRSSGWQIGRLPYSSTTIESV